MRILHTGDLHLGKRLEEYSLIEDQKYILDQILDMTERQKPDAVILAGDIYDKSQASGEAMQIFDDFLFALAKTDAHIFVLSGNHDSSQLIANGSRLVRSNVHLSPVYNGVVEPIVLTDGHGPVNFYMLPFIKPVHVRQCFPEEEINSYTDAVRTAIAHMNVDPAQRNVIVTHQFVTGATQSGSEIKSVGGTDNVDASVFDAFDYVALGHIHGPQNIGDQRIRYAGSPLKYSASEARHQKSVSQVELGKKGELALTALPLTPLHDLAELKGTYDELMNQNTYEGTSLREDYVRIILTDEEDVPDAMAKLRKVYHRILNMDYDNTRTRSTAQAEELEPAEKPDPLEVFGKFYEAQNGQSMSEKQQALVAELLEKLLGGEGA